MHTNICTSGTGTAWLASDRYCMSETQSHRPVRPLCVSRSPLGPACRTQHSTQRAPLSSPDAPPHRTPSHNTIPSAIPTGSTPPTVVSTVPGRTRRTPAAYPPPVQQAPPILSPLTQRFQTRQSISLPSTHPKRHVAADSCAVGACGEVPAAITVRVRVGTGARGAAYAHVGTISGVTGALLR